MNLGTGYVRPLFVYAHRLSGDIEIIENETSVEVNDGVPTTVAEARDIRNNGPGRRKR
jgi:hypothetical protein